MKNQKRILYFFLLFCILIYSKNIQALTELIEHQSKIISSLKKFHLLVNVPPYSNRLERKTKRFLEHAGITIVSKDEKADGILKVEGKAEIFSDSYVRVDKSGKKKRGAKPVDIYTGGSLSGNIYFEIPGLPIFHVSFESEKQPPYSLRRGFISSELDKDLIIKTFINEKFPKSFLSKLSEIIGNVFGVGPLFTAFNNNTLYESNIRFGLIAMGESALEPLFMVLKGENSSSCEVALYALGEIKDPRATPHLIAIWKTESVWTFNRLPLNKAEDALKKIGVPAVNLLIDALQDENKYVRRRAAKTLGKIGPEAKVAVPALIEALKDKDKKVRRRTVSALLIIGTPEAQKALEKYKKKSS